MTDQNPFDEAAAATGIDAMDVMEALPARARPSWSPEIDRLAAEADRNGWTTETLARALNRDVGGGAGPGVAMMLLRRFASGRPPQERTITGTEARPVGHGTCNMPQHGPDCQICYCVRGRMQHIVITPMPDWFREQYAQIGRKP